MTNDIYKVSNLIRTWIAILGPMVVCLFFFFSLKSGVDSNTENVSENRLAIEKMEIRMEGMNTMLQENNTNIKLLQLQIQHMSGNMDQLVTALGQ